MKEIADRIREIRELRGMTQADLATACGYKNRSSINKIESNSYDPSLDVIKKIARALNVDPDYLVFGKADSAVDEIHRLFSILNDDQKAAVLSILRSMTANSPKA